MRLTRTWPLSALAAATLLIPATTPAGTWSTVEDHEWCDDDDNAEWCEVREITLPDRDLIAVDAGDNGGIRVEAWDKNEIRVLAKIAVRDTRGDEAKDIAAAIEIETDQQILAKGPEGRDQRWSVSYRLLVPAKSDLSLEARNGGIAISGVEGNLQFSTQNGGIKLADVAGDVQGRTVNGGIDVDLEGTAWKGEGLDLETTNGGIDLSIPDGYSADLQMATVNGGVHSDVPTGGAEQVRVGPKKFSVTLGDGGALLRLVTTNGGIHVDET